MATTRIRGRTRIRRRRARRRRSEVGEGKGKGKGREGVNEEVGAEKGMAEELWMVDRSWGDGGWGRGCVVSRIKIWGDLIILI